MRAFRLLLLVAALVAPAAARAAEPVKWTGWSHELFDRAKAENRLVVLDLEAVWCHWCHVMDQKTYGDDEVRRLIGERFVAVRVDQDGAPDLASRYGDWGWPATIIFAPDGTEIAKIRGFVEPERFATLLKAFIEDPTPGPSIGEGFTVAPSESAFLSNETRAKLEKILDDSFDEENAGWGDGVKYIDADSLDRAMSLAEGGDKTAETRARRTLDAALALVDPIWGGVYQYSDKSDWSSPHFEKIMSFQAQYLRQYAQAYALWKDPRYLAAAKAIEGYLVSTLRGPEGAFYVSQDADLSHEIDGHRFYALDDAGRRKLGAPKIDTHLYARENGWAIAALAVFSNVAGDAKALEAAKGAARWAQANRALPGGGFAHGEADRGGPFLGDSGAMAQAFLELYAATGDRSWLASAETTADFIDGTFRDGAGGGFATAAKGEGRDGVFAKPVKTIDEQVALARTFNLLRRYSGEARYGALAEHAMRYLAGAAPEMLRPLPGVLLADRELASDPTHLTIVGRKDNAESARLFAVARAYPARYKRVEWWDAMEGKLPNADVDYPELDRPAAFACSDRICSLPAFSEDELRDTVAAMAKRAGQAVGR